MIFLISTFFIGQFSISAQKNISKLEEITIHDFLGSWHGEGDINYIDLFNDKFEIEVTFKYINPKKEKKLVSSQNIYISKAKKTKLIFEGNFSFKETEEPGIYLVDIKQKNQEDIKLQILFSRGRLEILNYFNGVVYFIDENKNKLAFKIYHLDKNGKKIIEGNGILYRKFKNLIKKQKTNKNNENKIDRINIDIEKKFY